MTADQLAADIKTLTDRVTRLEQQIKRLLVLHAAIAAAYEAPKTETKRKARIKWQNE